MKFCSRTLSFVIACIAFGIIGGSASPSFAAEFTTCKGETCALPKTTARYFVRYGAERAYAYLETEGQKTIQCKAPLMADMAIKKEKTCGYLEMAKSKEKWSDCAVQGQACDTKITANEVRRARLGYGDTWVYFYTAEKQFQCGLPYMGLGQERVCQISNTKFTASWSKCADEGKTCEIGDDRDSLKLVRFTEKTGARRHLMQLVTGKAFPCSLATFGRDPAANAQKMCEVAALEPVGSDVIAGVLKAQYAAEDAALRSFAACVKSNQIQKPVLDWPVYQGVRRGRIDNRYIPDLVGWRTCDLGSDGATYVMRYGVDRYAFVYQEVEGQKSIYCDFKLSGGILDGAPRAGKSCWKHKVTEKPEVAWTTCAGQGKTCKTGLSNADLKKGAYLRARYGKGSRWIYRYVSGDFNCTSKGLNVGMNFDPAPGVVKECQIAKATKATPEWTDCARENQNCRLPKRDATYLVRYGAAGNSQANFLVFSGRDFLCSINTTAPREAYKFERQVTAMSSRDSVALGDAIDPAPGKPKTCAYTELANGFHSSQR